MGNLRSVQTSAAGVALVVALALTGCSVTAEDPPVTPQPTYSATPAADPDPVSMDEDMSAPAMCGQISALSTLTLNAVDGHQRGELTDEQFRALQAAARFGYEHLSTTDARLDNAVDLTQRYLEAHPAPADGPALDDSAEWEVAMRSLAAACQDAGSSVVANGQYGG